MSQFAKCFLLALTRMWNDLPYTVLDTGIGVSVTPGSKNWEGECTAGGAEMITSQDIGNIPLRAVTSQRSNVSLTVPTLVLLPSISSIYQC